MGTARALRGLAGSCHPGPTAAVTVLVTVLAAAAGRDAAGCALVFAAVLTGQLSVGWCNDAADADRDAAAGRADKPIVTGAVSVVAVRHAALAALALCVPLSLASGAAAGLVHLAGVGAAWAYDLGVKASVLSWLPYAVGFGALPAFVTLGLPGGPWPAWWVVLAAASLGVGAHLANVLPDIRADLAAGVRGWPQRLGAARVSALLPLPLLAATALLAFGPYGAAAAPGWVESSWFASAGFASVASVWSVLAWSVLGWVALGVAGGLAAGGLLAAGRWPKAPFAAAVAVAGIDVALLVANGARLTG
ncbi:UbiA family prenyltransferase [Nonomuraea africana]|uniref:4-hydroxybenzoate polyprenyltransferase n=1 Tax=Nonomuraea africana TaxID=46171 RepID=A0ABR9KEA9_9ACTN|nr:UbiA family prenyltransferase [Nonomuraea africana]MBE1560364.1 4-hydroxybenzoate polyprenyltransferase [Nonomuraea africana]